MTYEEYRQKKHIEVNDLPIFFAFSDDQFKKAMEERGLTINDTDKVYRLPISGGFYLRKDADIIRAFFSKEDELSALMKDKEFAEEAYYYEMCNHEYAINWQGDWDVCSVFSDIELEYSDNYDYTDYLKMAGLEETIPFFQNAKKKYHKACEENDWF